MNEIQLHRLDLNLLVTFEALMNTRSVTVAADKLGKTPSAVSHALGRLRDQLGDPLMVKVDGKMQPSPFALKLIDDVRPILRSIQRAVTPPQPFDPATSQRVFRVAMVTLPGLMSRVYERVNAQAPDVKLEWAHPTERTPAQVAEGLVDFAMLGRQARPTDGVSVKSMPPLPMYTFSRSGHPALQNWSQAAWLRWPHIMIDIGAFDRGAIERRTAELMLDRTIGARVPDFGAIAPLLTRTNFLSNSFGVALVDDVEVHNLRILQPPIGDLESSFRFFWSSRLANDPALSWLRQTAIESYEDLVQFTEAKLDQMEIIVPRE